MIYRNVPLVRRGLERHRFPLALLFLAGLVAVNVLATILSLVAGSTRLLLW